MKKTQPLILLTNDDGIESPGIRAAAERLVELGNPGRILEIMEHARAQVDVTACLFSSNKHGHLEIHGWFYRFLLKCSAP